MDERKDLYEEEIPAEETPAEETPAEETPATATETDDGYFRFDGEREIRMPHPSSEPPQKNTLQTTSLVLSIVSFFCCGLPLSVAALVLAILDRHRRGRWEGMTTVALVLSIVGLVFSLVSMVYSIMMIGLLVEMMEEMEGAQPPPPVISGAVFSML